MNIKSQITQEDFESLLDSLSPHRETAGEKYERIRQGLIRFYRFRGCDDPESLTDETINRVAKKISAVDFDTDLQITSYFYSFATKIFLEDLKSKNKRKLVSVTNNQSLIEEQEQVAEESDWKFDCLEKCLAALAPDDRRLIIDYYSREKIDKLKFRADLAQRLNVKLPALHTRIFRLRNGLRECIEKCLEKSL